MLKKSCIFGFMAAALMLPSTAMADKGQVVVNTEPVQVSTCANKPVAIKPNSGKVKITQHRELRRNGESRTEVYQSTTTSTSTTNRIDPRCVIPQGVMNNVLIIP
jgi:hypothetical protein